MKKVFLFFVVVILIIMGCKKSTKEEMVLNISSADWYTTAGTFNNIKICKVFLKVRGSSNAAILSMDTGSDGIGDCVEVKCNSENIFADTILIYWFPVRDSTQKQFGTYLTAYSSRDKPNAIYCDAEGSGEKLTKYLVSPLLTCY
jgi:hypothetical protein